MSGTWHLIVGVAIGALATTIAADVFKCMKNLSYGIRNRIFIVYARTFEVRSLTISKSTCNTSMPFVLLEHGIRSYDAVAMYEVNEAVNASVEVGHTYLPTRAWSVYFMSMLGWTHTIGLMITHHFKKKVVDNKVARFTESRLTLYNNFKHHVQCHFLGFEI